VRGLIVNADGLGYTEGINRGIRDAVSRGIVRSVSALANMDAFDGIRGFHEACPEVSIGVHFNLTVGRPVSRPELIPTLIGDNGCFLGAAFPSRVMSGRVRFREMVRELHAQASRILGAGVRLTHFDGHQNKHLYPPFMAAALRVARLTGIKCMRTHRRYLLLPRGSRALCLAEYYVRRPGRLLTHVSGRILSRAAVAAGMKSADRLITPGYADDSSKAMLETWIRIADEMPTGISEVYCHPGYPDEKLAESSYYLEPRAMEVEVLSSEELRAAFEDRGVTLMSFYDLERHAC